MAYIDPKNVLSPRNSVSEVKVIFNTGPTRNSWSVARLRWEGEPAIGVRWNGGEDESGSKGNPQSRGNPTWFIVPAELAGKVLEEAERLAQQTNQSLAAAYREMTKDEERESEAEEWCEGLIGNAG
ncbi:MAG TPA: hypothetical protein VGH51_18835 [Candidatus Angelobacter sp.]